MKLDELFRCVRRSDIHRINYEYIQIHEEYKDIVIGTQMMQNDLQRNIELWDNVEQTVITLFLNIESVSTLKQEIIGHLRLSDDSFKKVVAVSPNNIHLAKDSLTARALSTYRKAYISAVTGNIEAFREQALDYRIMSGLKNKELSNLLQRLKELLYYVELDEINVKRLWKIYQKDYPQNISQLLYEALVNHIFQNGTIYIDAYLECILNVNNCLEEVV